MRREGGYDGGSAAASGCGGERIRVEDFAAGEVTEGGTGVLKGDAVG